MVQHIPMNLNFPEESSWCLPEYVCQYKALWPSCHRKWPDVLYRNRNLPLCIGPLILCKYSCRATCRCTGASCLCVSSLAWHWSGQVSSLVDFSSWVLPPPFSECLDSCSLDSCLWRK